MISRSFSLTRMTASHRALPLGVVVIKEVKAPEGYLVNDDVYVSEIRAEGYICRDRCISGLGNTGTDKSRGSQILQDRRRVESQDGGHTVHDNIAAGGRQ